MSESGRKELAIQALSGSETLSELAARHGVSRKFVYQQTHKARAALDDAFSPTVPGAADIRAVVATDRLTPGTSVFDITRHTITA